MPSPDQQQEGTAPAIHIYDSATVPPAAFACDVHTHTIYSRHAYSTIGECVAAARQVGLELIGSTDHYSSMLFPTPANPAQFLRNYQHFINFHMWPRIWDGVYVLHGAEADIVDMDGHLFGWNIQLTEGITGRPIIGDRTLKEHIWPGIDYAIASIHDQSFTNGYSLSATTNMYIQALADPKVLILGHAGRAGVPFEIDPVLTAAKELGKVIEINEHSFASKFAKSYSRCRTIAERCAELGVMISTGTDAHISCDVGRFDATAELLNEIHFPPELVATRSAGAFLSLLPA